MRQSRLMRNMLTALLFTQSVMQSPYAVGFQPALPHSKMLRQSILPIATPNLLKSSAMTMSNNNNNDDSSNRSESLRKTLTSLAEVTDGRSISVGSTVVMGNTIPNLALWQFQSYKLRNIYDQGTDEKSGKLQKIQRNSLDEPVDPPTYTRYIALYAEKHHGEDGQPVVVLPEEVELSSMQEEVVDSLIMALPLFVFWTALAFSFANQYTERAGGTFTDALFGR